MESNAEQGRATPDRLEAVSRQLAHTIMAEGINAEMVKVQFLSTGLYEVRVAERGHQEREVLIVSQEDAS